MKKFLKLFIICLFVCIATFIVMNIGLERHEKSECITWQQYEKEYPGFMWTQWQIDQCSQFN